MFSKLFASLWQGSMAGKPDVQLVFVFLLANANAEGESDYFPPVISSLTGLPIERVRAALDELEAPDPYSRSPEDEGRRLVRLDEHRDWGWRIVNYAKYRLMRDEEARREQTRKATARWREVQDVRTGFRPPLVSHCEPLVSIGEHPVSTGEHCEPRRAQAEAEAEAVESKSESSPQAAADPDKSAAEALALVSRIAGSARMPRGASATGTATSARSGPETPQAGRRGASPELLASVNDLLRPLGAGGVKAGCQLVGYLHKRGVRHPGLLLAIVGHWSEHRGSIAEPMAYYNPGREGWEQVRMTLAGRAAASETAALVEAERAWLAGAK